jgi:PAS domain S-box-containing protein
MLFDQGLLFQLLSLVSCTISIGVGLFCWRRRDIRAARAYGWVAFSQAWWTIGYLLELNSPEFGWKIFWDNVQFIGMLGWFASFVVFAVRYSHQPIRQPWRWYILVTLPMLALVVLAFTDPLHHLIRPNVRLVPTPDGTALLYDFSGPFLLLCIYAYATYLACVFLLLIRRGRTSRLYTFQIVVLVVGSLIPLVGSMFTLTVFSNTPGRDISPLTFGLSNVLIAWALMRYRLFDIVPVARDMVLEQMSDMVYIFDADDRLVDMNRAGFEAFPTGKAPTLGQSADEAFGEWRGALQRFQSTLQPYNDELELEAWGGIRQLELRIQPIYDKDSNYGGRVVLARDITERKLIEQQLAQYREQLELLVEQRTAALTAANTQLQQEIVQREQLEMRVNQALRLEALGRVTGGIAHDFNNILTVIQGAVQLALERDPADEGVFEDLQVIDKAVTQASGLTRHLLTFGRKQIVQPAFTDLNRLIMDMETILRHLLHNKIELQCLLQSSPATIFADPVQIQQVVMNLVVNARDAMAEAGTLIISTTNVTISAADLQQHIGLQVGQYVLLSVADTGMGMSKATLMQMFEPFFTTKQQGKGTGLGLAIVHGMVKQNHGEIEVESTLGVGTTFHIYLPQAEELILAEVPDLLQKQRIEDRE